MCLRQGLGAPCSCLLLEEGEGERAEPIGDTLKELGAAVGDEVDLACSRQLERAEQGQLILPALYEDVPQLLDLLLEDEARAAQ